MWWLLSTRNEPAAECASRSSHISMVKVQDVLGVRPVIQVDENKLPQIEVSPSAAYDLSVGDTVTFGRFDQDNSRDALEPLKWTILEVKGDQALLFSQQIIGTEPFSRNSSANWENSDLRAWLNGTFKEQAFNTPETAAIEAATLRTPDMHRNAVVTMDQIFCLSYAEVTSTYRHVIKPRTTATVSALADGCFEDGSGHACWWLRSSGPLNSQAAMVGGDGERYFVSVSIRDCGVRPAMWVNLRSGLIETSSEK